MKKNTVTKRILLSLLMLALLAGTAFADQQTEPFILGVDVSELLSQESSGVVYYDPDGRPADAAG